MCVVLVVSVTVVVVSVLVVTLTVVEMAVAVVVVELSVVEVEAAWDEVERGVLTLSVPFVVMARSLRLQDCKLFFTVHIII